MPVKFYSDPLRFAAVIREKPILSKYICMTAYHDSVQQMEPCAFNVPCSIKYKQSETQTVGNKHE